jgi:DNA modification methylase
MKIENIKTESLVPYARNAKLHDESQVSKIASSIREFGFNNPVLVDGEKPPGIIAGHGRVLAAKKLGLAEVPCIRLSHLTEAQRRAYILADNRLAELGGGWDAEMLKLELADLGELDVDLEGIGFGVDDLADMELDMGDGAGNGEVDAEPQIDKAEELREKWGVETGQLWQIGEHRILCGDSTKAEDVARVLAGDKPLLMVTDPPYGVEYDPTWRDGISGEFGVANVVMRGKVENDDRADWTETWALSGVNVAYVWHGGLHAPEVASNLRAADFEIRGQIIWVKPSLTLSRGAYHWQHEPCWYAVKKGQTAKWAGDRKQTTTWEIAGMNPAGRSKDDEKGYHGTQKPVECMARPIRNHDSEFVYEPFSGSGTTIIACEQLRRKCRAIEISPGYVAVAIQRWADATGKEPQLLK